MQAVRQGSGVKILEVSCIFQRPLQHPDVCRHRGTIMIEVFHTPWLKLHLRCTSVNRVLNINNPLPLKIGYFALCRPGARISQDFVEIH